MVLARVALNPLTPSGQLRAGVGERASGRSSCAILRTYTVKLMATVADHHNRWSKSRVFGIYIGTSREGEGSANSPSLSLEFLREGASRTHSQLRIFSPGLIFTSLVIYFLQCLPRQIFAHVPLDISTPRNASRRTFLIGWTYSKALLIDTFN